jgi:hypothetical protein
MMPCALPVECGVPPEMQATCHDLPVFQSGPVSWAHEPKLMSSSRCFFWVTKQRMEIRSSCLHHFLQPRTTSGWQSNHQETQLLWRIESAIIGLSSSMMTMRKNFRCCSWMQLDAGGVSLFRHRIAIAATRSCSVRHWSAGQTDVPHVTVKWWFLWFQGLCPAWVTHKSWIPIQELRNSHLNKELWSAVISCDKLWLACLT